MRIDVHGHFTMAPPALDAYRGRQTSLLNRPTRGSLSISDDELDASLAGLLAQMDERGIDVVLFSPRAAGMGHDLGDETVSRHWTEINNDLIARACERFPRRLVPVCQLPQSPGADPANLRSELERCAAMGFVGCLVNPDVSGGVAPLTPPLGDEWWDPLWSAISEVEMPAMIHASATRHPGFHLNASHYIAQHHAAAVELATSSVLKRHPALTVVVPHGGGAIPFHFNRLRALQVLAKSTPFDEAVARLYFDTSVYDADAIEMLLRKIGAANVLFGSEMFGTAKAVDPATGRTFDDIVPMIDAISWLSDEDRRAIYEGNAKRLYPRLGQWLARAGVS